MCIFAALILSSEIKAVEPKEKLDDKALEVRAREISKNLRCLVCRNENIDSSNAELAKDLRVLVRERLLIGSSNDEIINYVVDRYGNYVLLKPKLQGSALILWLFGPVLLLVGSIGFFFSNWVQRKSTNITKNIPRLTHEELDELKSLTND